MKHLLLCCLAFFLIDKTMNQVSAFQIVTRHTSMTRNIVKSPVLFPTKSFTSTRIFSDWSDFAYDDDDEVLDIDFADENDTQEQKAEVGSLLSAPSIEMDAEPILKPQGTVLPLTQENVLGVLSACREEIGTLFGYSAENRGVGITGGVDFVELDGPIVVLSLKGRFWHQRPTVLARVGAYIQGRIPEVIDVIVSDEYMLTDEANDAAM